MVTCKRYPWVKRDLATVNRTGNLPGDNRFKQYHKQGLIVHSSVQNRFIVTSKGQKLLTNSKNNKKR